MNLVEKVKQSDHDAAIELIKDYLREQAAEVTQQNVADIRDDVSFEDLGFESMESVEFTLEITDNQGLEVDVPDLYNNPSINEFAVYLLEMING